MIWNTKNKHPETYIPVILEYQTPYGNQLPKEEQDSSYICITFTYEDDNTISEERFNQCDRWCYLEDLIKCSNDIVDISKTLLEKAPEMDGWYYKNFNYLDKK